MLQPLSPALEDYLETIMHLSQEGQPVKISEIARRMDIAKPSVTQAIAILKKQGLVHHDRYGPVVLTKKGARKASDVWHRHQVIRAFLEEILEVAPAIADADACVIEHAASNETLEKMEKALIKIGTIIERQLEASKVFSLNDLAPGVKARVVKMEVEDRLIKRRLLDMGVVPGVEVEIERIAPLGDPIEICIKGYHLSLRRSEAAAVMVEML